MPDSPLVTAWRETYSAQCEMQGTSPKLAILADTNIDTIEGEDQDDPSFFGGGIASGGRLVAQCVLSDLTARPQKGDMGTITGRGSGVTYTAQVIDTTDRNGILYLSLGDNTAT